MLMRRLRIGRPSDGFHIEMAAGEGGFGDGGGRGGARRHCSGVAMMI